MQLDVENIDDGLTVFNLSGPINAASELHSLLRATSSVKARGTHTILLDFSAVSRVSMAGLAAVVEFCGRPTGVEIGLISLPQKVRRCLENKGLDYGLNLFEDHKSAFSKYRAHATSQTTSVLLCDQQMKLPSGNVAPTVSIDVFGLSLLERALDQLKQFGCRRCILLAGKNMEMIADHLKRSHVSFPSVFLVPERMGPLDQLLTGALAGQVWSRLWNLHLQFEDHAMLLDPTVIAPLDPAEMIRNHKRNASFLTVGQWPIEEKDGRTPVKVSSAMVSSQYVASIQNGFRRVGDAGVHIFGEPDPNQHHCEQVNDVASYQRLIARGLSQSPLGWIGTNVVDDWRSTSSASITKGKKIDVEGRCYIGPGASVGTQVTFSGACSIGANATVSDRCYLRNCIVLPGAVVPSGTWANDHVFEAPPRPIVRRFNVPGQREQHERLENWG